VDLGGFDGLGDSAQFQRGSARDALAEEQRGLEAVRRNVDAGFRILAPRQGERLNVFRGPVRVFQDRVQVLPVDEQGGVVDGAAFDDAGGVGALEELLDRDFQFLAGAGVRDTGCLADLVGDVARGDLGANRGGERRERLLLPLARL